MVDVSYDLAAWQIFEVLSREGTHVSIDNHLLVPVVDMVPAYWRSHKKILNVYPVWPVWVCKTSQTRPIICR